MAPTLVESFTLLEEACNISTMAPVVFPCSVNGCKVGSSTKEGLAFHQRYALSHGQQAVGQVQQPPQVVARQPQVQPHVVHMDVGSKLPRPNIGRYNTHSSVLMDAGLLLLRQS